MYVYKVVSTGNYYLNYPKAVQALRGYVAQRFSKEDIIYDNLNGYYDENGNVSATVDNIPQIVCTDDDDNHTTFEIFQINVRE